MSTLDSLGEAPSKPIIVGHRGTLLKKSGGKAFEKKSRLLGDKWTRRWFVLPPGRTTLSYYKNEAAANSGAAPLGTIEIQGAVVFLKAVKSGQYRFTVRSSARELKLRAADAKEYDAWMGALQPITEFREDDAEGALAAFSIRDDDDDADFDAVGEDVEDDDDDDDVLPPLLPMAPSAPGLSVMARVSLDAGLGIDAGQVSLPPTGMRGILEKKSGGKEGKAKSKFSLLGGEKWSKRWFILKPEESMLRYYKSESEANAGKASLGEVECQGATVFLKKVEKGGVHRFTVQNERRALKLRAPSKSIFDQWIHALRPFAAGFADDDDDDGAPSARNRGETMADGDDDDDSD